ncbi:Zinc finger protein 236 [Plecturocebus cupreus]
MTCKTTAIYTGRQSRRLLAEGEPKNWSHSLTPKVSRTQTRASTGPAGTRKERYRCAKARTLELADAYFKAAVKKMLCLGWAAQPNRQNLICSECGDEFTLQSQLAMHMEEHRQELAGTRQHACKACKKEFETSSELKEHMKTHYKIRVSSTRSYNRNIDRSGFTYSCPHCGKTFQKPSQLTRHIRIHTGERPFKCSECGKAFNQKGALQTHMIKHTGEKPHACAFCPAAFSQKGNLQSHVQRVHSETLPLQQTEARATSASSQPSSQAVSDVIQQLLELSEPGPVESGQSPQPGQQLSITVGINQDILQVKHAYLRREAYVLVLSQKPGMMIEK